MSIPGREPLLRSLKTMYPSVVEELDPRDYLSRVGSPANALLYAHLYWPMLVEIDGLVLLRERLSDDLGQATERVRELREGVGGDAELTERWFNLVDVAEEFVESDDDNEIYSALTEVLCEIWAARLAQLFSGKTFAFDKSLEDASFTFYQIYA